MNFEGAENQEPVRSPEEREVLHPLAAAEVEMFTGISQEQLKDIQEEGEDSEGGLASLWSRLPEKVQRMGRVLAFSTILAGASACGPFARRQQYYSEMKQNPEMAEIARKAYEQEVRSYERRRQSDMRRIAREEGKRAAQLDILEKDDPWGVVGPRRALDAAVHDFFDAVDEAIGREPYEGPRE